MADASGFPANRNPARIPILKGFCELWGSFAAEAQSRRDFLLATLRDASVSSRAGRPEASEISQGAGEVGEISLSVRRAAALGCQ